MKTKTTLEQLQDLRKQFLMAECNTKADEKKNWKLYKAMDKVICIWLNIDKLKFLTTN